MKAQVSKLAAVAAMAIGLAMGGGATALATTASLPAWEALDGPGGGSNARRAVIESTATCEEGDDTIGSTGRRAHRYGLQLLEV